MTNPDPAVLAAEFEREMQMVGGAPGRVCIPEGLCLRVLTVLRAQPDPAMVEEIERDIRIAVWNTCRWQGKPQEVAQSFIQHLFADEPCMTRAIAALSKPSTSPATPEKQGGGMG
jgi:hypothetical protein